MELKVREILELWEKSLIDSKVLFPKDFEILPKIPKYYFLLYIIDLIYYNII